MNTNVQSVVLESKESRIHIWTTNVNLHRIVQTVNVGQYVRLLKLPSYSKERDGLKMDIKNKIEVKADNGWMVIDKYDVAFMQIDESVAGSVLVRILFKSGARVEVTFNKLDVETLRGYFG